jgi:tripartite-type tricarboxylate transporter receptor subunit TctC
MKARIGLVLAAAAAVATAQEYPSKPIRILAQKMTERLNTCPTRAARRRRGKVIGITTAKKSPLDPSWATPRDAGIQDLDASIWVGLFAPKGRPQGVVDKLNAEVRKTLADPDVKKRFIESGGAEAVGMSPAEFLTRIRQDADRYGRVVKAANVKAE